MCLDSFERNNEYRIYATCLWRLLVARCLYERNDYVDSVKFMPVDIFKENCPKTWSFIETDIETANKYGPPTKNIIDIVGIELIGKDKVLNYSSPEKEYNQVKELLSERSDIYRTL